VGTFGGNDSHSGTTHVPSTNATNLKLKRHLKRKQIGVILQRRGKMEKGKKVSNCQDDMESHGVGRGAVR
jgi:hypothetical protein